MLLADIVSASSDVAGASARRAEIDRIAVLLNAAAAERAIYER